MRIPKDKYKPKDIDNLLIIDHNIIRYHHYDLMESLISNEKFKARLLPSMTPYLSADRFKKIAYLAGDNQSRNILNYFSNPTPVTMEEYRLILSRMINVSGSHTNTDMANMLVNLVDSKNINATILQFQGDSNYNDTITSSIDVMRVDNIFDRRIIKDIIDMKDINAIMTDDIDLLIELGTEYKNKIFMIPTFNYNLAMYSGKIHFRNIDKLEAVIRNDNEISSYNPFSYIQNDKPINKINED